jgi:hypothetical protein
MPSAPPNGISGRTPQTRNQTKVAGPVPFRNGTIERKSYDRRRNVAGYGVYVSRLKGNPAGGDRDEHLEKKAVVAVMDGSSTGGFRALLGARTQERFFDAVVR